MLGNKEKFEQLQCRGRSSDVKTLEWSVLTAGVAGIVLVVFMMVMPAASGLAGQIGLAGCTDGPWTPLSLSCGQVRAN